VSFTVLMIQSTWSLCHRMDRKYYFAKQ